MFSIRTDLALESRELYKEKNGNKEMPGIEVNEYSKDDIRVTNVDIINEEGEKAMGKPIGKYITIDMPKFAHYDSGIKDSVSKVLAKELSALINLDDNMTAMVVGLGNKSVTPDALGPKVVSQLMITRHLKELVPNEIDEGVRPVCALAPGVLGTTGIETSEIVKSVVQKIKPNLVICIDALASRKMQRVNSTIQISSTGISPGSGVGNRRAELSEKTLNVPVIAVGVPTVVDAATVTNDTIDLVIDALIKQSETGSKFYNMLKDLDKNEKFRLIQEVLEPYSENLMVTPKEVDMIIDSITKIIANGINIALQPALELEDINKYLN
ncbi:GPR endopeptidase [Haloimpatiens sp. FM7315]|uniref:GPR endopeptidase n=1 Tax=Haloimpatiens sp. FM7315 TaxID=3298609 RepID=UPI0035A3C3D1